MINNSILFEIGTLIIIIYLSIKLILVAFIFVENIEDSAFAIIKRAWNLSKGRCLDIANICLKIFLSLVMVIIIMMVVILRFTPIAAILWIIVVLLISGLVSVYISISFAGFALKIFKEENLLKMED